MRGSNTLVLLAAVLTSPTTTFAESLNDGAEDHIDDDYESTLELSATFETSNNYNLDDETLLDTRARLRLLELSYKHPFRLSDHWAGAMEVTASITDIDSSDTDRYKENLLEFDELWIGRGTTPDTHIWAGRREIVDETAWWWDESLLGIGISFKNDRHASSLITAMSSKPWNTANETFEQDEKSLFFVLGSHETQLNERSLLTFFVHHQADASSSYQLEQAISESQFDESDESLTWVGVRLEQDISTSSSGDLSLSFDAAWMTGKTTEYELEETDEGGDLFEISDNTRTSISAWGVNSWIQWQPSFFNGTDISIGFAYGTGTNNRQTDGSRTFRQTGLHSNTPNGAYYGYLSEPELSNLSITSLLVRQSVFVDGRILGQLNTYRRASVYDDELSWEINLEPQNNRHNLGLEVSLGYEHEFANGLSTETRIARFYPGDAFAPIDAKPINYYLIELSYEF